MPNRGNSGNETERAVILVRHPPAASAVSEIRIDAKCSIAFWISSGARVAYPISRHGGASWGAR